MSENSVPRVLIIAGSDSGGGAGIQADIKTCAAFGVYSSCALTAVTAQNTLGVQDILLLPPALVAAQIKSVMIDLGADIIKIGMLGSADIAESVADAVDEFAPDTPIVFDPVMVATSGDRLLDEDATALVEERILPMAEIVTPNIPEAEILAKIKIDDMAAMSEAGEVLLGAGAHYALIKGGHLDSKSITDILVGPDGQNMFNGPRIYSRHTHGTGCTLASAIAALLARGEQMEEVCGKAREFVFDAIKTAPKLGGGNGPLNHGLEPQ